MSMTLMALALAVLAASFLVGASRLSPYVAGAIFGCIIAYPSFSAVVPFVPQSAILGGGFIVIAGVSLGQAFQGLERTHRTPWIVLLGILAVTAVMWLHSAPAIPENRDSGRLLWIAICAIVVAFTTVRRIDIRSVIAVLALISASLVVLKTSGAEPGNPIWSARTLATTGILAAISVERRRWKNVAFGTTLVALFLFFHKEGPLAGLIAAWLVSSWKHLTRAGRIAAILSLSSAVVGFFMAPAHIRQALSEYFGSAGAASDRIPLWSAAVDQYLEAPLTGGGFGSYVTGFSGKVFTYPHNFVLEWAAEHGTVGVALLLLILVLLYVHVRASRLLPLFVATLVAAMFSGAFESNHEYWMVAAVAFSAAPIRRLKASDHRVQSPRESRVRRRKL